MTSVEQNTAKDIIGNLIKQKKPFDFIIESAFTMGSTPRDIITSFEQQHYWIHVVKISSGNRKLPNEVAFHISEEPLSPELLTAIERYAQKLDKQFERGQISNEEFEYQYWNNPLVKEAEALPHTIIHSQWKH